MAIISYMPEMGETKPTNTDGDVRYSYRSHYTIKTPLELKGRGVKFTGKLLASHLVPQAQHKAGWNQYWVTERALEALSARYTFAREALLD